MGRKNPTKNINIGLLAHVDAGKTTLSEALLYATGQIRALGRVDHQDAFLDTDAQERARGITIFSKQARLRLQMTDENLHSEQTIGLTILDTPGHVDFSAEMERTLQVLDYAILVISGTDGVQGHTRTLWRLLQHYNIPTFLFVNKMDLPGADKEVVQQQLKTELSDGCVDFTQDSGEAFFEEAAMGSEALLDEYMDQGSIAEEHLAHAVAKRELFPCYYGSALKVKGVKELLAGFAKYHRAPEYEDEFSARVYKIGRDAKGARLTYLKVTCRFIIHFFCNLAPVTLRLIIRIVIIFVTIDFLFKVLPWTFAPHGEITFCFKLCIIFLYNCICLCHPDTKHLAYLTCIYECFLYTLHAAPPFINCYFKYVFSQSHYPVLYLIRISNSCLS